MSAVFAIQGASYPIPDRLTCFVQEGISFEATQFEFHPTGVFVSANREDLTYTESVRISFAHDSLPPVAFEGQVATWVRGRGVRIEAIPDTPSAILRILESWSQGTPAEVTSESRPYEVPAPMPLEGCRVLVIDDDPGVVKMIRRRLSKEGCEVHATTSPPNGVDFLAHNEIDAIVMDWMLPTIPGQELLEQIRLSHPRHPVAVLSGALFWEKAEETLLSLGASAVFHKPLDYPRLLTWLRSTAVPTPVRHARW